MNIIVGDLLSNVNRGNILHGCNAKGVMGGGIALQIKNRYPKAYEVYREIYEKDGLKLGQVIPVEVDDGLIIWNMITQDDFGTSRRHTDYSAIEMCFKKFHGAYNGDHIHFPLIGCGLGGGQWCVVKKIIDETLKGSNSTLWVLTQEDKIRYNV